MGSEIMHVWTIGSSEDEDVINALPARQRVYCTLVFYKFDRGDIFQ